MMIKFAIIGTILLAGGIIFSNEINQLFPNSSSNFLDSVTNDFEKITDDTVETVETGFGGVIETVNGEVENFKDNSANMLSENFNEISKSTHEAIFFGTIEHKQNDNPESVETHGSSSVNNNQGTIIVIPSSPYTPQTISFETLSLTTTQQLDDSVMLSYEDTSGKTISVTVTMRTIDRELFTGIFYSSMFEAYVNNAPNTSYFIDMTVEHQEYGTISSSVFNPAETPETIINGVFSGS